MGFRGSRGVPSRGHPVAMAVLAEVVSHPNVALTQSSHRPSNRGQTAREPHDRGTQSDRGIGNRATVGPVAGRAAADAPLGHRGRHHGAADRNGGDNLPPASESEGGASVCVSSYGGAAPPARLAVERAGAPPTR